MWRKQLSFPESLRPVSCTVEPALAMRYSGRDQLVHIWGGGGTVKIVRCVMMENPVNLARWNSPPAEV